eukprot:scaffold120965_cov63-Phaeocystis_antarctica.AAC.5
MHVKKGQAVRQSRSVSARQAARNHPRPAGATPPHLGIASGSEDKPHDHALPPRPLSHRRHCGLLDHCGLLERDRLY